MAKLVSAETSQVSGRKPLWVRLPPPAPPLPWDCVVQPSLLASRYLRGLRSQFRCAENAGSAELPGVLFCRPPAPSPETRFHSMTTVATPPAREIRDSVVIRFAGDSGDGMRATNWMYMAWLVALCSCGPPDSQDAGHQDSLSAALPAPTSLVDNSLIPLAALMDSLSRVAGEFVLLQNRWSFSGDEALFARFVAHADSPQADSVVRVLVTCLDRTDPVRATVAGRPTTLGFMCFEALRRVANYEWGPEDEVGGLWPGILEPDASPPQLREAKRAWLKVVGASRYRLN